MDSPQTTTTAAPAAAPSPTSSYAGISDSAAADRFESLWDAGAFDGPGKEPQSDAAPAAQAPAEAPEAAPTEAPADTAPAPASEDAAPAEAAPDYDDFDAYLTQQQIDAAKARVRVKVDGKEQQAPLADVIKAYELSQAGHARLAEAAKARDSFAAEKQQAIQAFVGRAHSVEAVGGEVKQFLLSIYDQAIQDAEASGDGLRYSKAHIAKQQAEQWFAQRLQSVAQQRQQEAQVAQQASLQALPQERERMLAARPEWREPSRLEADHAAMREFGRGLGFTDAELGTVTDHRQLLALDSAARYAAAQQAVVKALGKSVPLEDVIAMAAAHAKLQASIPEVTKTVGSATRMSAPGTRPTAPKDPQSAAYQQLRQQAKKSGYRDDDAAALLERMF